MVYHQCYVTVLIGVLAQRALRKARARLGRAPAELSAAAFCLNFVRNDTY